MFNTIAINPQEIVHVTYINYIAISKDVVYYENINKYETLNWFTKCNIFFTPQNLLSEYVTQHNILFIIIKTYITYFLQTINMENVMQ